MKSPQEEAKLAIAKDKVSRLSASRRLPNYINRVNNVRFAAAAVFLPLLAILLCANLLFSARIPAVYTNTAQGVIIRKNSSYNSNGKTVVNVDPSSVVAYTVNGRQYTIESTTGLFGPGVGAHVAVSYSPSNPRDAKARISHKQLLLNLLLFVGVPALLLYISWRYLTNLY